LGLIAFKNIPMFEQSRLSGVSQELKDPNSSSGLRMGFYKNCIQLIEKHPILGVGTGAFKSEYRDQIGNIEGLQATSNPHNQYLLVGVETGLIGLFVFLGFLFSGWRISSRLTLENVYLTQGLVVLFSLGCLFNSLLFDAGEGRFSCTLLAVLVSGLKTIEI
jgi:O-antigen ligase